MNIDEAITNIKRLCEEKEIVTLVTDRREAYYYMDGKIQNPFKRYVDPSLIGFSNRDAGKYELLKRINEEGINIYLSGIQELYYLTFRESNTFRRIVLK